MKIRELHRINKLYFGYEEIASALGINNSSARVSAARYVKQGLLLRMKKNMYVRKDRWRQLDKEEKFVLANLGQSPSYISLMTALDYYEITTQVQRNLFECIAQKRTREILVDTDVFRYKKMKSELYFEFQKTKDFFIASPEKALLDAFYLMSYGRYALDLSAIDREKIDGNQVKALSRESPEKTRSLLKKNGYI